MAEIVFLSWLHGAAFSLSYVGGDYAKFHFFDRDRLIFMICDVTGHGVAAALLVNRILLFTDGVLEATNAAGEAFGATRVEYFLKEKADAGAREFNEALIESLRTHNGGVLKDDIFLLSIKIHG